ncbi:MAG TPA: hypothetical protein PKA64_05380, partial [Myxococcota bacterium]|nr:hypothetical protein [Myxococcota bacterium]
RLTRASGAAVDAVWWGRGDLVDRVASGPVELLGHLEQSQFAGRSTLRFVVTDARDPGVATAARPASPSSSPNIPGT